MPDEEQIFSPETNTSSLKTNEKPVSPQPPQPPQWRMPFWLWLVIIILVAALVVVLIFWLGGIKLPSTGDTLTEAVGDVTSTPVSSVADNEIVITSPQSGDIIANPVTITGRGRAFENTIMLRMKDGRGSILAQTFAMTDASGPEFKGDFVKELNYSQPTTPYGFIEAYEQSAMDGSEQYLYSVEVNFTDWTAGGTSEVNVVFLNEDGSKLERYDGIEQTTIDYGQVTAPHLGTALAVKDQVAYIADIAEDNDRVTINAIDLNTKVKREITSFPRGDFDGVVATGLVTSSSSNELAISLGYIDDNFRAGESPKSFKIFIVDTESGDKREVSTRESTGVYYISRVEDWSALNDIYLYEFIGDGPGGAYGETIQIKADTGEVFSISKDYGIYGLSRVSPNGQQVAFIDVDAEELDLTKESIVILDLATDTKDEVYSDSASEEMPGNILGIGDFRWLQDGTGLIWGTSTEQVKKLDLASGDITTTIIDEEGTVTEIFTLPSGKVIIDFIPNSGQGSKIMEVDPTAGTTSVLYTSGEYVDLVAVY